MSKYKRVLLKLSGEALSDKNDVINPSKINEITKQIKEITEMGIGVVIVVGGGNILRGKIASEMGIERSSADYMGMLATIFNALAVQNSLEQLGVCTRVQTAFQVQAVAEPYIRRRALRHLEKGRVVILGGGVGNPYFSTDTTASLRAAEVGADIILMAKNGVDGVYDSDPKKDKSAKKISRLTYMDILQKKLAVMDMTAVSLCNENGIPMIVFDMNVPGNIVSVAKGENIGTMITKGEI